MSVITRSANDSAAPADPNVIGSHGSALDLAKANDPPPCDEVEQLLERMRHGDREAAAEFITRFGARIRRRVRGKLGPTMRRLFDSQEILSTVGRRLDLYVCSGRIEAAGTAQLWSLVFKMADNALVDKVRVFKRLQAVEETDGPFAHEMLGRLRQAENLSESGAEIEIDQALHALGDQKDRQILSLWLDGQSHVQIAAVVGIADTGVRKRWQSIKERLREHFRARRN